MLTGVSLIFLIMGINIVEIIYVQIKWTIQLCKRWKARSIINTAKDNSLKDKVKRHVTDDKNFHRDKPANTTLAEGDVENSIIDGDLVSNQVMPA